MLFGVFSFNDIDAASSEKEYALLEKEIRSNNSHTNEIQYKSLRCTLIHHELLPQNRKDQYLINEESDLVFILAGQIYPYTEHALEQISKEYRESGIESTSSLNGDYALVIIDLKKQEAFLIKNHLGTVPISVALKGNNFYFGQDTMGMSKALFGNEPIRSEYIQSRFFEYQGNYTELPDEHVQKVLPGHYLKITPSGTTSVKYWFPEKIETDHSIDFGTAVHRLETFIHESVIHRTDYSYTAGSHISGGLDSSLIAALMRNQYEQQQPFYAFTWSPSYNVDTSHLPFDERKNIKAQAEKSGFEVAYTDISIDDYDGFVQEWRCPSEYIFEHKVVENAVKLDTNLIFSGWGGDEFIGIRDEGLYFDLFRTGNFRKFFGINRQNGWKKSVMHVVNNVLLPTRRKKYLIQKMHAGMYAYMKPGYFNNKNELYNRNWFNSKKGYQLSMIGYRHIAERCEDWYILGQRNGVEYRYPLLDLRIVEYSLSLPPEIIASDKIDRPLIRELAKPWLVDEIRMLVKQSDPVVMTNALHIQENATASYMKEVGLFRENPYLEFIDFDRLENDYNSKTNLKKVRHTLHYIKAAHEFTVRYPQ